MGGVQACGERTEAGNRWYREGRKRSCYSSEIGVERIRAGRCCRGRVPISLPVYWPPEKVSSWAGPGGSGCGLL